MNILEELRKRKIKPYELSEEDYQKHYANIYWVLGSRENPEMLRLIIEASINQYQLLSTQQEEPKP